MTVSQEFIDYLEDKLQDAGYIYSKRMFGGVGIYLNDVFFAIVADDILYFKVTVANEAFFEDMKMPWFRPYKDQSRKMKYRQVPDETIESNDLIQLALDSSS